MYMYNNNVRIAKKIAIGTIISGLIFLATYYFTYDISFAYGGLFFGVGVAAIVITILISGAIAAKRQNHSSKEKSSTLIWNLISLICIAIFTAIGLCLVNSAKIVIKNNSDNVAKNIFITGCQNFEVEDIEAQSSKTVFVHFNKNTSEDCSIGIRYTTTDSMNEEVLITSVKPFEGEQTTYEIN